MRRPVAIAGSATFFLCAPTVVAGVMPWWYEEPTLERSYAGIATRRVVEESAVGGALPDLLGVGIVSVAVASLALGITQGNDWGWSSERVLGAFAASCALGSVALLRSARHPSPAIDLRIFESRTASLANAATLAYAIGFFAMLLGNVLFLTEVWGYSTLKAGLAITPGPLVVAALSRFTGTLAARFGYRPVLVVGGLVFAAAELLLVGLVDSEPAYLSTWLPVSIVVGVGVALTFPVLSAAAVAGLPPDRFAAGGATNQTARQLGAVLGVALLVAILGTPISTNDAVDRFHRVWFMCAGAAALSSVISAGHRRLVIDALPDSAATAALEGVTA